MSNQNIKSHRFEPSSEDTVQCFIFSPSLKSDEGSWEQLCEKINSSAADISEGFLWHRDEFKVFMPLVNSSEDNVVHLTSNTCFGDNIEDEWFIVHIILKLTAQYPDLIVQILDNDGDFLLIEAADYLPSWANPDSTENRVFIHKSHIHIIPPKLASVDEKLKLNNALLLIEHHSDQTQASPEVQRAILNRIGNYPDKHKENTHNAIVKVPLEIAALLKLKPNFIAPIVDTYCHHDDMDIKSCRTMTYNDSVNVTVKFTKCLYAMLLHSKAIRCVISSTEKDKSIVLGKKIACGYKIIMNRFSDIFSSKEYHKFLKSLTVNGYFRNNIEGSQEYKKLLEKAKDFFSSVECPIISNVAHSMSELMSTDEYLETKKRLQNMRSDLVEDDEGWLNIHPEQLNNLLNSRYGKKTKLEKNDLITPQNIASELSDFLKKTSDYEGIETVEKDDTNNEIEFDPDQFVNCVEKMLKLISTGEEQPEIDSDFSDDVMSEDDELDQELRAKLQGRDERFKDEKSIFQNMMSSMKEEHASSGPTSNLMTNLGLSKTDFLDSDDDE